MSGVYVHVAPGICSICGQEAENTVQCQTPGCPLDRCAACFISEIDRGGGVFVCSCGTEIGERFDCYELEMYEERWLFKLGFSSWAQLEETFGEVAAGLPAGDNFRTLKSLARYDIRRCAPVYREGFARDAAKTPPEAEDTDP